MLQKRTHAGNVLKAVVFDSAYVEKHKTDTSGMCIRSDNECLLSVEGDDNELRVIINDEVVKNQNVKIIHCKDSEEFAKYKPEN